MPGSIKDLISYRISRSKETIEEVEMSIKNGKLYNAVNRIYYSMFYIVSALAIQNNFLTSKHRQLLAWFNVNYVKTGIVPVELWKTYKHGYDNRLEGDYDDFKVFTLEEVQLNYQSMLKFVDFVEKLIIEKN